MHFIYHRSNWFISYQNFIILFGHINIRNCTKVNIFADFGPLSKTEVFFLPEYELHIILYETASFIQTADISGFTGYITIWGMFERSGQILMLQSTCKANYINIHSFVLFKIHDIQAFTNPQASTCDPPCLRHITQVKLSAHSSGWAWEPASSLAGARSPLAAGGSWGAVPGRGGMMNNICFLIGCAIRHTPASPQLQRAQQYVTVTGRMAPMHHPISVNAQLSRSFCFHRVIFLLPALNKRKLDSSCFSFFFHSACS